MKIKRSKKKYGGGGGKEIYASKLFRVILWELNNGIRTTIKCSLLNNEIHFDGKQEFTSDKICIEQLTVSEILKMIKNQKEISLEEGSQNKLEEIKKCLKI